MGGCHGRKAQWVDAVMGEKGEMDCDHGHVAGVFDRNESD